MNEPRAYIQTLRQACKDALARGEQLDFFDALAISRPTGEQAVYWMLPELRSAQAARDALRVRSAELYALAHEALSALEGSEQYDDLARRLAALRPS